MCEKSRAALDSLKQLFLICWKDEEAASPHHHHHQNFPTPYRLINFSWDSNERGDACEKSKQAFNDLNLLSIPPEPQPEQQRSHLLNGLSNKNLFLIHIETGKTTKYVSYSRERHDWGSNDIMVNLRSNDIWSKGWPTSSVLPILEMDQFISCISKFSPETNSRLGWMLSLWPQSVMRRRRACSSPSAILTFIMSLVALKKSNGLDHLSLQWMRITDQCVEVLRDFSSLSSLHLEGIDVSGNFVTNLAELRPAHLSLSSSLQRLHIHSICLDWRRSTGFLHHWPLLKELSLLGEMTEEELMDFMDHLAPPKKGMEKVSSTPSLPPRLYSLSLGGRLDPTPSVIAAVIDALSGSGLPFFELKMSDRVEMDPAIEAQLERNRRVFMLGGLETVPATSMRLFICRDHQDAGKLLTFT